MTPIAGPTTRIVWRIERAASPAAAPLFLAEDDDEVLAWTQDCDRSLRFTDRHLAARFARNRMSEPVCLVDHVEDGPTGWTAANLALRHARDEMDALQRRRAEAPAPVPAA